MRPALMGILILACGSGWGSLPGRPTGATAGARLGATRGHITSSNASLGARRQLERSCHWVAWKHEMVCEDHKAGPWKPPAGSTLLRGGSRSVDLALAAGRLAAERYDSPRCLAARNASAYAGLVKIVPWTTQEGRAVLHSPTLNPRVASAVHASGRVVYVRNQKVTLVCATADTGG